MSEQINRIREKIEQLKKLDKGFRLFGSEKHRYKINPPISLDEVQKFELSHNVTLPKEYVEFITAIGNGGAGPFYGLERLEDSLFDDLDYKRPDSLLNPGKPFLHIEPWNLIFTTTTDEEANEEEYEKERSKFEEEYFEREQVNGVIAICNYGCAISINLVVNGQEYGNIWTDDRASDNGIYPSHEFGNKQRLTFLNWYELWLDNSIKELSDKFSIQKETSGRKQKNNSTKRPWWKIW